MFNVMKIWLAIVNTCSFLKLKTVRMGSDKIPLIAQRTYTEIKEPVFQLYDNARLLGFFPFGESFLLTGDRVAKFDLEGNPIEDFGTMRFLIS